MNYQMSKNSYFNTFTADTFVAEIERSLVMTLVIGSERVKESFRRLLLTEIKFGDLCYTRCFHLLVIHTRT